MDLFGYQANKQKQKEAPLADRIRAADFGEFVGQAELIGEGQTLRRLIDSDQVPSMVFWGPPGTGKTTLARLIAKQTKSRFVPMSAVSSGVAQLREVVKEAEESYKFSGTRTIVFIDEIHRWNKAQQDAFLPYVEDGTVILIGATTENPSFEVNSALLSRARVFVLKKLEESDIEALLGRALKDEERGLGRLRVQVDDEALRLIAATADGDARTALNTLEMAAKAAVAEAGAEAKAAVAEAGAEAKAAVAEAGAEAKADPKDGDSAGKPARLTKAMVSQSLARSHLQYDRAGEEHFNIISALHKSMRGSNPDAALYWLGRMIEAGENPLYVARRLVRFASEDIGLADPNALVQANAAFQAAHQLGLPECNVCLAQAVVYMARAPKSNDLYSAYGQVQADIAESPNDPVPLHLRNAPTKLMKELNYGKGYVYSHNVKKRRADGHADDRQEYFPERLKNRRYLKGDSQM